MASKYAALDKPSLVEEIKKRRAGGSDITVDITSKKEDLIAALEMDDISNGEVEEDQQGKPVDGSFENQIEAQPEFPLQATQPDDEAFAKGFKAKNKADNYTYQVIKQDQESRPYKARIPKQASGHPGLFWEGTEDEFKDNFDRL